jgi:hypothetical protein
MVKQILQENDTKIMTNQEGKYEYRTRKRKLKPKDVKEAE